MGCLATTDLSASRPPLLAEREHGCRWWRSSSEPDHLKNLQASRSGPCNRIRPSFAEDGAVLAGYDPVAQPDTGTYVSAARDLATGDWSRSEGRRTPGYPLFIALLGDS